MALSSRSHPVHTSTSETEPVAKSYNHHSERFYRLCREVADPYSYCTATRSRTTHSAPCTSRNFRFWYHTVKPRILNKNKRIMFAVYGAIETIPSQPFYILFSYFYTKAMHQLKRAVVVPVFQFFYEILLSLN